MRIQNTDDAIDSGYLVQYHRLARTEQRSGAMRILQASVPKPGMIFESELDSSPGRYKGLQGEGSLVTVYGCFRARQGRGDSVIATVVRSGYFENTPTNRPRPIICYLPSLRTPRQSTTIRRLSDDQTTFVYLKNRDQSNAVPH